MATYCRTTIDVTTQSDCITNIIWVGWIDQTNATCSASIWNSWNSASTALTTYLGSNEPYVDARTPEQRAADNARMAREQEVFRQQAAASEALRKEAALKARQLLLSMLVQEQREQLEKHKYFEVIARGSRRRYRIKQGTHGNVKLLNDKGQEVVSYCGQPTGVPTEDSMLAQKLQIEHDEATFLRLANATQTRVA